MGAHVRQELTPRDSVVVRSVWLPFFLSSRLVPL